jgi:protein-tyrosine phosphatase
MSPDRHPDEPVRLLTVCTGNICRSPYAEALLRDGLHWARPGGFEVSSAGTHAVVGRPMDPESARLLRERAVDDGGFRARMLTARIVREQDLVLVMAGQHRAHVLDEDPAAHRRTVGLLDLAAGLEEIGDHASWQILLADRGAEDRHGRWRELPLVLAQHRGRRAGKVTDVPDPIGRGRPAFERMAAQLDEAVRRLVLWEAAFPE